ncbi:hypothetical protein LzC2_06900 [Planctomycetes bacterium LzC2]|uniref:Ankyrin repeat domain-containing protein n=2 Tax=Alienimonas chondri TaxID=2681879 RepID=A0ABX1VC41_9PLAN|nr:hypothetical protein [Alienimonas chondri]
MTFAAPVVLATGCNSPERQLVEAAADGDLSAVRSLLADGVDANARPEFTENRMAVSPHPWSALHEAIRGGHVDVVRTLLRRGADPDLPVATWQEHAGLITPARDERNTPLRVACQYLEAGALRALLDAGADTGHLDARLNDAARAGFQKEEAPAAAEVVWLLVEAGASPDGRPGARPLMTAVAYNRPGVVGALLEAGADPNVHDPDALASWGKFDPEAVPEGETPGGLIAARPVWNPPAPGRAEIVRLLRAAGAKFPPVDAAIAKRQLRRE